MSYLSLAGESSTSINSSFPTANNSPQNVSTTGSNPSAVVEGKLEETKPVISEHTQNKEGQDKRDDPRLETATLQSPPDRNHENKPDLPYTQTNRHREYRSEVVRTMVRQLIL